MARLLIAIIILYQKIISPDHGLMKARYPYGFCRHYPSCSQYAKESLEKYGTVKGVYMSISRILRCNPWTDCSFDPVP